MLDASGSLYPLLQLVGHEQSEVTGPAFSPDGSRLYVRSDGSVTGFIDVWGYTPATGAISSTPLLTISGIDNDPAGGVYYGIDQIALSADGSAHLERC